MKQENKPQVNFTEEQWRERLTPERYRILRESGTEMAFTGEYVNETSDGTYRCAGCNAELFSSEVKYHSNCGWPSFYDVGEHRLTYHEDRSHGWIRTEVRCANCGSHLGHVFEDGPQPTGLRYCINSLALDLEKSEG